MKSLEWKTYRTRFLVKAKQLSSNLTFTDHLGRQHCGRRGDYLVESCDGVLSIAPRQIFEDVYVPMGFSPEPSQNEVQENDQSNMQNFPVEPLTIQDVQADLRGHQHPRIANHSRSRVRKSPQPVRVTTARLSLM